MPNDKPECWYRMEVCQSSSIDENERIYYNPPYVRWQEYEVIKLTPKGAWIRIPWHEKRFVLRDARKRFACPTKEEAKESFLARKRKHIRILKARLGDAEHFLSVGEKAKCDQPTESLAW